MPKKCRNEKLYETMQQLVASVSDLILKGSRKRPFQDISMLLLDYREQIELFPESKICEEIMHNDESIRREFSSRLSNDAGEPVEKPGISTIYRVYIIPLLAQYFKTAGTLVRDEDIFSRFYFNFEEFMYSETQRFEALAPLAGFNCNVDVIQLDENLKIRKMKEEEVDRLWKPREPYLPPIIQSFDAHTLKFTLEAPLSRKKDRMKRQEEMKPTIIEIFEGVITALRLFKSGGVDFYFTQETPLMWDPIGGISYSFKQRGGYFGRGVYYMKEDEIDAFISFWKEFRDNIINEEFRGHNYVRIALKRINFGLEERESENKLIDFFVAFEALFLQETSELSYRLSLRTATLLGNSSKEKKEIFNFMRDAYVLRSKIIHGKTPKIGKKRVDLADYVLKLENYLRNSIINILKLTDRFENQEAFLQCLDEQIVI